MDFTDAEFDEVIDDLVKERRIVAVHGVLNNDVLLFSREHWEEMHQLWKDHCQKKRSEANED